MFPAFRWMGLFLRERGRVKLKIRPWGDFVQMVFEMDVVYLFLGW
jgi:hypothetical protein